MRHIEYIEIENFKRFGALTRIELGHPAVLIGPNNGGKTSVIQALALWSQAVRAWYDVRKASSAKERTATSMNRLNILAVPVRRTRFFWHDMHVRRANADILMVIGVGVWHVGRFKRLAMSFRSQGDELVYCQPVKPDDAGSDIDLELIAHAASLGVDMLYPMSGLDTEEPVLQPGRVDVLLGQGRTADVLRNLCLAVAVDAPADWERIVALMRRLFSVELATPAQTTRGSIEMQYRQAGVKGPLDLASAGRGFLQLLLVFAYLYSHKNSVLLIDEPDAHLEILRQKQVYVLLRDIAAENGSQVVLVTHSEVILDEALDTDLTLLLDGQASDLARKADIRNSLKHFGTDHYVKARQRGYVLYVAGGSDVDMLRALAVRLDHPVVALWDERLNSYYTQDNYPAQDADSALERVEGGFGATPKQHFHALRELVDGLRGLAILDSDARGRTDRDEGGLHITHWRRYETENYVITPQLLGDFARTAYPTDDLLAQQTSDAIDRVLGATLLERVFDGNAANLATWREASPDAMRLIWEQSTERRKLSDIAEDFFRRLADEQGDRMLLRKGQLHRLVAHVPVDTIPFEVTEKLDLLAELFRQAPP